jgi:hypothetical protein
MTFNKDGTAYIAAELPENGGETMGTFGLNGTTSDDHKIKLSGGGTKIIVVSDCHLVFSRE